MAADPDRRLSDYVATVAAATPTPGGGSVAAVVGALAAALGEMVANHTHGRDLDAEGGRALGAARERLTALRQELLAAAAIDEAAYERYRLAAAMPRASDEERAARRLAMREALILATEAPLAVARAAAETASLLETIALLGNPRLRTDAALGALLSQAALRGALLNVRGNAAVMKDEPRAASFLAAADVLDAEGAASAETAYAVAVGKTDPPARR
jgi:formiminotetrahydrofolate cyclodeaminase